MKITIFFLSFFLLPIATFGQNLRIGEPSKCYGKSYVDSKVDYDIVEVTHPIFTGDENEKVELETITLSIEPATTKWEKCPKNNQDVKIKSTVWCLVENPGESIEIQVVIDTTKTKNFILETFQTYKNLTIETPDNSSVWTDIICEAHLTKNRIHEIQEALRDEGFYNNENTDYVNDELKTALFNFQKSINLPFGQFDKATLKELNIKVR